MIQKLYTITCLTNLHVGSGDVNFNIVDKEVEKDPVTGYPMIHSSGIKGALRDACTGNQEKLFGTPGKKEGKNTVPGETGTVKFFNAYFLCRPMRVSGGTKASIPVTTVDAINSYVEMTAAFGCEPGIEKLPELNFGENQFLSTAGGKVEDEATGTLTADVTIDKLKAFFGGDFAIAKNFDGFDLPVIARNNLSTANGNLWYEEYVPRGSKFYMLVLAENSDDLSAVIPDGYVQLGGNNSIGNGYCSFQEVQVTA